ncbi:MAG: hypothetical protein ACYC1D_15400 [Acidimicrobiales bacterium]
METTSGAAPGYANLNFPVRPDGAFGSARKDVCLFQQRLTLGDHLLGGALVDGLARESRPLQRAGHLPGQEIATGPELGEAPSSDR